MVDYIYALRSSDYKNKPFLPPASGEIALVTFPRFDSRLKSLSGPRVRHHGDICILRGGHFSPALVGLLLRGLRLFLTSRIKATGRHGQTVQPPGRGRTQGERTVSGAR